MYYIYFLIFCIFKFLIYLIIFILIQVTEIYNGKYAPTERENVNIEYNSSDDDLITHINKKQRLEPVSELECYLKTDRASALCDILNWWKVSYILVLF